MILRLLAWLTVCLASANWVSTTRLLAAEHSSESALSELNYDISWENRAGHATRLVVTVQFSGEETGSTVVVIPSSYAGVSGFEVAVDLKEMSGATRGQETDLPDRWLLVHEPGARISLTYTVRPLTDPCFSAQTGRNPYEPCISQSRAAFIGYAVLAFPEHSKSMPVSVVLHNACESESCIGFDGILSSLDRLPAPRLGDALNGIFLLGDFEDHTISTDAGPLSFVSSGEWGFSRNELIERLVDVESATAAFWNEPGSGWLFALLPSVSDSDTIGGTALSGASVVFASSGQPLDEVVMTILHERLHHWFPGRLSRLGANLSPDNDAWLVEGFTDFLTLRIAARNGLVDSEFLRNRIRELWWAYQANPLKSASNAELAQLRRVSRDADRMPYLRGAIAAFHWDAYLKETSAGAFGMDDVLREMRDAKLSGRPLLIRPAFIRAFEVYLARNDFEEEIAQLIDDGGALRLPPLIESACQIMTAPIIPIDDLKRIEETKDMEGCRKAIAGSLGGSLQNSDVAWGREA